MYSEVFCRVYNEFGWNYYPEAFGGQLLQWLRENNVTVKTSMDLACGTGVLCELLHKQGIEASGMDFSEGMIAIARENNPKLSYDVADMTLYRPDRRFDLVTCTGDALNHIMTIADVEQIFRNVYGYLNDGGHFIFDLLNEQEVSTDEPFDLDFSDTVRARFQMLKSVDGTVNLKTRVYENGEFQFEENIYEKLYDPQMICALLEKTGFQVVKCADRLPDNSPNHSTTWYIIAKK